METEKEQIYAQLQKDFEGFARQIGGWASESGTELDGLLWKVADRYSVWKYHSDWLKALLKDDGYEVSQQPTAT